MEQQDAKMEKSQLIIPMMRLKLFLVMFTLYIAYLFLGAAIYFNIEYDLETERRAAALAERLEINGTRLLIDSSDELLATSSGSTWATFAQFNHLFCTFELDEFTVPIIAIF